MKFKNQEEVEIKYGISYSFVEKSIENSTITGVKLIIML